MKSCILTPPHHQEHGMSVKCEEPLDEHLCLAHIKLSDRAIKIWSADLPKTTL